MEPTLSYFQLQQVRYTTKQVGNIKNSWRIMVIQFIFATANSINITLHIRSWWFVVVEAVLAGGFLVIDPVGKYFERNYGEITRIGQSKEKNALSASYIQFGLALLLVSLVVIVVMVDFQHPGFLLSFTGGTLLIVYFIFWCKSSTREVWFFQPLIFLAIFLLVCWRGLATHNFTYAEEPDSFIPLVYMSFAISIACDLIILLRTLKQIPPEYKNLVLQEDQPAPLIILQTLLIALSECQSADTVYLGKLTSLSQETLIQILVPLSLSNDNVLRLQQKPSNRAYPVYTVSLTETGTTVAQIMDNQQALNPIQSAS